MLDCVGPDRGEGGEGGTTDLGQEGNGGPGAVPMFFYAHGGMGMV